MADKRKNNGGPRKGAGRPPKAKEIELIQRLTPLEDTAFKALEEGLKNGEFPFVKLFLEYRFGKAKDSLDITTKGKEITTSIAPITWLNREEEEEEVVKPKTTRAKKK